ncbi:MAG: anthranilate synthase component I [Gammaproteobacteria bacterium]|jgi:anthranilate synthase component 1|nr:anthranilate synthase component I [Gammaproteobacteria bacterium]MBK6584882.1 anthranilate synthase component I [Gammaproteobacteria bacterium]MBK7519613.1 anthranilate synthase component I [Gammaproteobacteria bacterium]MBK7731148.1 anthranilate synthase component I [Gammaproteobacteria bacterium]MBK9666479.1 anthranilate synthase component I [Gammaproteobacteria bacterium]
MMNRSQLVDLARQGFSRVPVVRRLLADLETPLSAYLKFAGPCSFLLESVEGGEKWGRYSIIGLPCARRIVVRGHRVEVHDGAALLESSEVDDPLAFVQDYARRERVFPHAALPMFSGGLVGYFGYDCARLVERRLAAGTPPDVLGTPDILLLVAEEFLVFDNLAGAILLATTVDPRAGDAAARAEARLDELQRRLDMPAPRLPPIDIAAGGADSARAREVEASFVSECGRERYEDAVRRIREYILAGDVMQVVPSQRLSAPFAGNPVNLYRALRNINPSPYLFFFDLGDFQIVGSSPEVLSRLQGEEVTVRPIAGTRRRGRTQAEDLALERELLADPKEIAEHLMLIDLGRNDVGRVARTGSVVVSERMIVERYSHVMHIVSNVCGQLREGLDAMDVLRATLPAGTLSGAPKIRAMEIIDELEPSKRGIYGGAVGYLSWHGDMDTAIAIRTAVISGGKLHVQAGGGVVADSVPALEWEETMNKARAMFRAAAMVLN